MHEFALRIPDRYEHLVRYVGWYSNRARGERAKKASPQAGAALLAPSEEPATEFAARAKAAWARLMRKVYEADPLECPVLSGSRLGVKRPNTPEEFAKFIQADAEKWGAIGKRLGITLD